MILAANLALQDTIERTHVGDCYGDEYRGLFVVRGENVVLLGEVDDEKDTMVASSFREVPPREIARMAKEEQEMKRQKENMKNRILHNHGFSIDHAEVNDHY
ncbi:SM-like, degradation of cytoplasmic mRNAs and positively regulates transcription initiation [Dinochytrium kinnereticum]|nr:SM-like, degradation of cytoplasmic mRNAs and positively regulates transcription initiation [Dinochytrium kinnereticum]